MGAGRAEDIGDLEVVPASTRHTRSVLHLIEEAGWAYTEAEVTRLIEVQPDGMLLLRSRGLMRDVRGCVYASAWGKMGFIGLMLVRDRYRGRGYGRALMDEAMAYLGSHDCAHVGLDAVGAAVGFYSKLGFRAHWESLRLSIDTSASRRGAGATDARPAGPSDLHQMQKLDALCSGMDRSHLIARLAASDDCTSLVAPSRGHLLAFGALRRSKGCMRLGPLVAVSDEGGMEAARQVVLAALEEAVPRLLSVNVPAYNAPAVELMDELHATQHPPCVRMYDRDPGPDGRPPGVWAMGAAEKG